MPDSRSSRSGLPLAVGAYGLWGFLPAYFLLLTPSGAVEIVAWRVVLSLVFCVALLALTRAFRPFAAMLRDRRIMVLSLLAGILIAVNWTVYVYASTNGFIVEAALGYFINPIVTVALGVLVLRERLRPWQWAAVGISIVAVLVLAIGYGQPPWVALTLAASFGVYGLLKNRMGPRVTAVAGLTLETAWLTPIALIVLVAITSAGDLTMGREGLGHAVLLGLAGVVTAVPLLLFAAAARRLPLTVMGFIQYLAPLLQFAFGVAVMGEPMPFERWVGFGLVWLALVVLTVDAVGHRRRTGAVRLPEVAAG
ncbi:MULTISPECIES: EamA family transporter RarD [unclassified Microcella]|uniref:EamA family transporter RarD n=1 Tax=unclassified Microcella TaxID=2630066 RepID=UPI0006FB61D3|nr:MULTISPECIES: EamA family transporter RarD [unclassified Microcella]KQV26157.1 protein rarD [Yonghaparkia sp. Root332]KRF33041.1 protein rarD [Yonghaparkia sp. Soil809]